MAKKKVGERGLQRKPLKVSTHYKIDPELLKKFRQTCKDKSVNQTYIIEKAIADFIKEDSVDFIKEDL